MKRIISLIIVIMMAVTTCYGINFTDINGTIAVNQISTLAELGILNGENGLFRPKDMITRAEFAKIIYSILEKDKAELIETKFSDVPKEHWASGYINYCYNKKIINGESETTFEPERNVTFEEAVKMTIIALGYEPSINAYGYPTGYLQKSTEIGVTKGLNCALGEYLSRENAAIIIHNAINIPIMKIVSDENGNIEFAVMDGSSGTDLVTLYSGILK